MKSPLLLSVLVPSILGVLALTACAGTPAADSGGNRPTARVTSLFEFPEIPGGAKVYLQFQDSSGKSARQEELKPGETSKVLEIQNLGTPNPANLAAPLSFKPVGATVTKEPTPSSAKIYGLALLIFVDKNASGGFDEGELLFMTHDRVLYSTAAFTAAYSESVNAKTMTTTVSAEVGWTRLEHFVYLPLGSSEYKRTLTSTGDRTFYLHKPTPETSM